MKLEQSNTYVRKQITHALLKLMETQMFAEIKITDIVRVAMVGRASFYRNFASKEEVLKQYLMEILKESEIRFKNEKMENADWVENLFSHYKYYSEVYYLLYRSNLSHLILDNIKVVYGPKIEQDNLQAYVNSWLAYGLFGWINEWIARGMKESPKEMSRLIKETKNN